MHISIITGSHRTQGESTRIGHYLEAQLKAKGHDTSFINAGDLDLPFWDEGMWGVDGLKEKWAEKWQPIAQTLQKSDGFVVISPEYNGMIPSRLKNFLLLCSAAELGHKPVMGVSVSSSLNGAYIIAELRAHSFKNSKAVLTPEHLIVRNAASMFGEKVTDKHDQDLRDRAAFAMNVLVHYAQALKPLREKGAVSDPRFPFGM